MLVKILKRTARFDLDDMQGPAQVQSLKLNIPKKTKLFVDQTMRERENSVCKYIMYIYSYMTPSTQSHAHSCCVGLSNIHTSLVSLGIPGQPCEGYRIYTVPSL